MLPSKIDLNDYPLSFFVDVGDLGQQRWAVTVRGLVSSPESGFGDSREAALADLAQRLAYRLDSAREDLGYAISGRGLYNPEVTELTG